MKALFQRANPDTELKPWQHMVKIKIKKCLFNIKIISVHIFYVGKWRYS